MAMNDADLEVAAPASSIVRSKPLAYSTEALARVRS